MSETGLQSVPHIQMYIQEIITESFDEKRGVYTRGRKIECTRFRDDMVILGENKKCIRPT